ncbi:hypothetical protein [Paenibacillus elgii]|uniref:hypothetical protein n=1 Tax=Paenibacillus elgii TaxID=189691 RepID=UPI000248C6E3|nr:hypothetical protein [Paenibacillus elgii]
MTTELKPNFGNFTAKGIVTGLDRDNAFTEGQKEGKNPWKKVQFGAKVSETQFVYVELMGAQTKDAKFVYRDPSTKKVDNSNFYFVPWKERYKHEPKENYEMSNTVTVGLERGEDGKKAKDNKVLTAYDAVDYIKKFLKNGESIYVRGQLQITEYNGRPQEKYVIQKIYVTSDPVNFKVDNFEPEASFNQEIVYLDTSEDSMTGKTFINTNIIYKRDGNITYVPYSFIVDAAKYKSDNTKEQQIKKMIQSFNNLPYGSTIRVTGNINIGTVMEAQEDDFGGFSAKGQEQYVKDTVKELEITSGSSETLVRGRYTYDDFYNLDNSNSNQFIEDSASIDISDDELPF